MVKKMKLGKKEWTIIVIIALVYFVSTQGNFFQGAITGSETVVVNAPAQVSTSDFPVEFEVVGATGNWGASIVVDASGCTVNGNTHLDIIMVSDIPNPLTYTATMTSDTCTISGDYKFGTLSTVPFQTSITTACQATCTRPVDMCTEGIDVSDGCNGDCDGQWAVTKRTSVDNNCDDIIDRNELGTAISGWISTTFSRGDLGIAIQSWVDNS